MPLADGAPADSPRPSLFRTRIPLERRRIRIWLLDRSGVPGSVRSVGFTVFCRKQTAGVDADSAGNHF